MTRSAFTIGVFAVLGALMLLLVLRHITPTGTVLLSQNAPAQGYPNTTSQQAASNTSPLCPGKAEVITAEPGQPPQVINPQARCVIRWAVDAPLKLIDTKGKFIIVGPQGGDFRGFWTESVQAVDTEVTMHYWLYASL